MAKVGRNDPCPCGSGKKYKHCCLRKDQARQRDTARLSRAQDTLPQKLWQFAVQKRFSADLEAAFGLFWNNRFQPSDLPYMQPELRWRFVDWYVHDFRTSEGRKTPAELFARDYGDDLQPGEREILDARIESVLSVYEVLEQPGEGVAYLQLEDVLQGEEGPMRSTQSWELEAGSFFWSRLISVRGFYSPVSVSMILPPEMVDDLEALVDYHFERYQAAHYGASKRQFLKDSGYLFNHYFMDALHEESPAEHRASDEEVARDMARQFGDKIIVGSVEQHYERWLDERIPAWGNKSPRQLVESEEGRARISLLLKEMESVEERKRIMGQPAYDIDRLRARLGLIEGDAVLASVTSGIYVPR